MFFVITIFSVKTIYIYIQLICCGPHSPSNVVCPPKYNSTPEIESWDWVNAVRWDVLSLFPEFF